MTMTERQPLTRERVIRAAVSLTDAHGVDELSMRKLGAALGVEAMSLYNYVENKDDLIDGVLDAILGEIVLPPETWAWDEQLRAIGHAFRRAGHDHPRIFPLFGSRSIRSISGLRPLERSYAVLRSAGLQTDDALDAFVSLASFVFGYVLTELGGFVDVAQGRSLDVSEIPTGEHPWLIEMGVAFANRDGDRQFEFGLERMLRGLHAMVEATSN